MRRLLLRSGEFRRDERGSVLVFFAISLPVLLLTLALSVDWGLVRLTGNRLQISADAAALAGASQLPEDADAVTEALAYAAKNFPESGGAPVLKAGDVLTGHWDGAVFAAGGTPKNAVQVTTRRSDASGNPLGSFFARLAGITQFEITRTAVAQAGDALGNCRNGGFFSDEEILSGSNNSYVSDFCLYGRDGVKISSDNSFGPGTVIGMNDLNDFEQGGNNQGAEEALQEMDVELLIAGLAPEVISSMESGLLSELPDFITSGPVFLDEITDSTPLTAGTLYVVDEVADFGSDAALANIAVVAGKEIKVGSDSTVENVVFASPDKILLGSNNEVGGQGACGTGSYNVYLFSESNIEFGSNNDLRGVQMGAGEELKLGSDVAALMNVYGEAYGKIDYGSAEEMGSCANGLASHFGSLSLTESPAQLALVQ